jgi:6-phosphogluconolactonase
MASSADQRQPGAVDLRIEPDIEAMSAVAAHEIQSQLEAALADRGVAHMALSGGTTPVRTYELLANAVSDWDAIEVWFADERCVGPEDEQSNYRLVVETFGVSTDDGPGTQTRLQAGQIRRMQGELGPQAGADHYAGLLRARVPGGATAIPVLDLVVLGIGPEGHIASLFPDSTALAADGSALCLGVEDSPKPPPQRVTLTLEVLYAARCCLLLASGAGKAEALAAGLGAPTPHAPTSLLARERLIVVADEAAAVSASGKLS